MEYKVSFLITFIIFLPLIFLTYYVNDTSNKGIFFGVRIPLGYENSNKIKTLNKYYKKLVTYFVLLPMIFMLILGLYLCKYGETVISIYMFIFIFTLLFLRTIPYIICYKEMKSLKIKNNWTLKRTNIVFVDTTLRKPKKTDKNKPIASKYYLLLFVFPLFSCISTLISYNQLPSIVNIPFFNVEIIEKETLKGFLTLFQIPISQLFIACLFTFISYKVINSKSDLNSGSIEGAVTRKKAFKKLNSIFMLISSMELELFFFLLQIFILNHITTSTLTIVSLLIIFFTMVTFIIQSFKIGQGGRNIKVNNNEKDDLFKDDDYYWILGCLYYNKNDPSIMVEKRVGIGWTVNFGNPKSFLITSLLLVFILLSICLDLYY